jgi:hypothetical protein
MLYKPPAYLPIILRGNTTFSTAAAKTEPQFKNCPWVIYIRLFPTLSKECYEQEKTHTEGKAPCITNLSTIWM